METKLWEKPVKTAMEVERFTIGKDAEFDIQLAEYDVLGSLAHVKMLSSIGLLSAEEEKILTLGLREILSDIKLGLFTIEPGVEDIHSQIEILLTRRKGEVGKRIHSGRSRNDQVLVDLKLFMRDKIKHTVQKVDELFSLLIQLSEKHKEKLLPGYTHFQIAMPSSFGLWFGAYAESLVDDLELMHAAYRIVNKNPLGSAAGYGSSFPLDRSMTKKLLGFENLNYNVVYAQMARGKTEKAVAFALASVASTLSKMAMDICMYSNKNHDFISFPDNVTTGSSIMPHKKNPDVFELIRARCNKIQALPGEITLMINNLPSGYHRDFQLLKESLFPAFNSLYECISMTVFMLNEITVKENILTDLKYKHIFSVEKVNERVLAGIPFRDAYKEVSEEIETNNFSGEFILAHTHEGSIGNLCNNNIADMKSVILDQFQFQRAEQAIKILTKD
jgi:argininosuccinate lyase